jgi:N-methylhydantoinase A/oxoprolinase/acetone carboxylase beta subunit
MTRKVRIGIDVGGTFTKAVLTDNETYDVIGKETVLTTHYAPEGVARGIVQVFHKVLEDFQIETKDVVFIAHSTTQATNALLEGDVETVGIVGMGTGFDGFRARRLTNVGEVKLAPGRTLKTVHSFIDTKGGLGEEKTKGVILDLINNGAKIIVASEAFGVDNPAHELSVVDVANRLGIPAIGAHEISKLYGLETRTRTAVINASIIPKMLATADMIERSVRKAGIKAPLMIMRGDGGVMNIGEMRKRPLLTLLSGPAASVAGALMYLKVSDGIFFEVGGTSTNIGVIRNGRPKLKYVELGGHHTFLHSLDVRVLGIAGGSMVRFRDGKIIDIGPRSAHIAGLTYSAFAKTDDILDPEMVPIQPMPNDPSDYVGIKTKNGKMFAITVTCAANALKITRVGDYAHGNPEAAKKAIEPLAEKLNLTVEETARKILEMASAKIVRLIKELMKEYALDPSYTTLVGGGGGASALIPFTANAVGLDYRISENAEVISSIGVALAMVRDAIERMIINPTPDDILRIRREAEDAAIRAGAAPGTVEVSVEIDPQRHRVIAIALGATELKTKELVRRATSEERKLEAAKSMRAPPENIQLVASTNFFDVFTARTKEKGLLRSLLGHVQPIRVVDKEGVIRLSIKNGVVFQSFVKQCLYNLKEHLEKYTLYTEAGPMIPDVYLLCGGRIVDLSGVRDPDQISSLLSVELKGRNPEDPVVLVLGL